MDNHWRGEACDGIGKRGAGGMSLALYVDADQGQWWRTHAPYADVELCQGCQRGRDGRVDIARIREA